MYRFDVTVEVAQLVNGLYSAQHLHTELASRKHRELATRLFAAQFGDVLSKQLHYHVVVFVVPPARDELHHPRTR